VKHHAERPQAAIFLLGLPPADSASSLHNRWLIIRRLTPAALLSVHADAGDWSAASISDFRDWHASGWIGALTAIPGHRRRTRVSVAN